MGERGRRGGGPHIGGEAEGRRTMEEGKRLGRRSAIAGPSLHF
jgi:hypothetical protein